MLLQVAYWRRFVPLGLAALRQRIRAGELGRILAVNCYQWDEAPPGAGFRGASGGIFADMGVHEFDQVRWLTGQEFCALRVAAAGPDADGPSADGASGPAAYAGLADPDCAQAVAGLDGGGTALISLVRWHPAGDTCRVEVLGTAGTASVVFLPPGAGGRPVPRGAAPSGRGLRPRGHGRRLLALGRVRRRRGHRAGPGWRGRCPADRARVPWQLGGRAADRPGCGGDQMTMATGRADQFQADLLEALGRDLPADRIVTDPDVLAALTHDEAEWAPGRPGRRRPSARAPRPRSQHVVRVCRRLGVPVVPRGAGTGLSGGANAVDGCVVLDLTRMTAILEIDTGDLVAVVQPGVVNDDLQAAVAEHGLWYPPDPASAPWSTIGGNVATNAGGLCCLKYGVTRDYVLGARAVVSGTGRGIGPARPADRQGRRRATTWPG